jgi:Fe-S-cluster-containing dehydrogenase component
MVMKNYWRSIQERDHPVPPREVDDGRSEPNRRDFLKAAGFSLAAVTAACHRPPVGKAIPYLTAPEQIVPGRAYSLASTCHGCPSRCGILVKCRDGRPIKIEGNPEHPLSRGGVCAVGQATLLGLYDSHRLTGPLVGGAASEWSDADRVIAEKLATARKVRVISSTLASPTASRVIRDFTGRFEDGRHVVYDVPSCSAIADAHEQTHGARLIPHFRFDRAEVILGVDADFLGTWISPVEFTKGWSASRPGSWHVQLEPRMSLTGSKADQRLRLHPADEGLVLAHIAAALGEELPGLAPLPINRIVFDRIVERLDAARGKSLVVCGSSRIEDQIVVNRVNELLGNYGSTLLLDQPSKQREGNDRDLAQLVADLDDTDALFVVDCNPVYDLPQGSDIAKRLARVPLVVAITSHHDETSQLAHVVAPDHHFLESWRDSEPVAGVHSVTQPAIAPLRNTRSMLESFAAWSGKPAQAYDLVRSAFAGEWEKTVHDGVAVSTPSSMSTPAWIGGKLSIPELSAARRKGEFSLVLYPSIAMLDGRHAHNPWLHELPDPMSKVTWDNYAALSPDTASSLGVRDGDEVRITAGGELVELPAFVQPGQHDGVVAIALGYGRFGTERFSKIGPKWLLARAHLAPGEPVGQRAVQLAKFDGVTIAKTGRRHDLATTQLHNTMVGRNLARELDEEPPHIPENANLWPAKTKAEHKWAMAIDLTRCTGCAGCVIACQAENNVPVVGKDEVLREREMHWIRIDRYYAGEGDEVKVAHQPMMCHHCGNAPCETVCPVLATVHSTDGLNQQVYNRCVGTRYCANNCPYKTRRFNWFDYPREDRFANLVLNPDVTVRTRGVMEKCSMCVQRIEEARIEAKQRGAAIADGAIQMACQQSCPADAIVFGNINDPNSRIAQATRDPKYYRLLEEINVDPGVGYLRLTRNTGEVKHV